MIWAKRRGYFFGVGESFSTTTTRWTTSVREAQLAQHRQVGHRPADGKVELLPVGGGELLRPGMDAGHIVQTQLAAGFPQELDPLVEAVQQRHMALRQGNGQRYAGEPGAGAHVHHRFARHVRQRQQAQAVQQVQRGELPRLCDGRQVHHLVLLQN